MNPNRLSLQKVVEAIQGANSGVICIPENATPDSIAAATALYLGLNQLGKNVSLASSSKVSSNLVAADKFQPSIATSGDNLVVSFPYTDGSADRVDYFIQGDEFNIVVTPGANHPKLDPEQVKFGYSGGSVDFIVTIDTPNPRALGSLFAKNQDQFKGKKLINIDRHVTNSFYGTVNIVSRSISSTSELVLMVLTALKAAIDRDIATNLYTGVVAATNNFTAPTANAETFEHVAQLLKAGAQKPGVNTQTPQQKPQRMTIPGRIGIIEKQASPTIEDVEYEDDDFEEGGNGGIQDDQDDEGEKEWLKPKIFRKPSDLL